MAERKNNEPLTVVFMKLWLDVKHSTIKSLFCFCGVFQVSQLQKHFSVSSNQKRRI
jgi:hypothetical protein